MVLHNHPSGRLEPSGADLNVAARLHDAGVGFGIVEQRRHRPLRGRRGAPRPAGGRGSIRSTSSTRWARGGPVAAELGQYEDRRSQRDMAAHIADGYNDGGVQLLEAGTGVGKSFAYLVPALAWARANGERTVVSTNTINLQEQLVGKDLPLLRQALAHGRLHADLRAAQGLAELPLPVAAAPGGGGPAHAAGAGQARRADRHRRVGRATRPTAR